MSRLFVAPLLAFAAVAAFGLSSSRVAVAADLAETTLAASNCTYYSNAAHTTVVGRFGKDCCNNNVAWGSKTAFKVCGGCFPCTPPPP
jgi:hypothetical protein